MSPLPRRFLLLFPAAASVVATSACSVVARDLAGASRGSEDVFQAGSSGAGGGGVGDTNIDIGSNVAAAPETADSLAALCGEGCKPGGDPSECAPGGDPGMGGGGTSKQVLFCRLDLQDGAAAPQCLPVGTFAFGRPCQTGADCAAGHGCVTTETQGGVCRQYCCGSAEECASDTYCDAQTMAESTAAGGAPVRIPVCIPATNCELLNDSTCPADLTCTIVRDDGTTSCVPPGTGQAGEDCPCGPGLVCSRLTNECKKLCRINNGIADCGMDAKCQGGSMSYPSGFGVCVGGDF